MNRKRSLLNKIDDIFYGIWKVWEFFLQVVFVLIALCWNILKAVLKVIFSIPVLRKAAKFAENAANSAVVAKAGKKLYDLWGAFRQLMDTKPLFRCIVLPAAAVLTLLLTLQAMQWLSSPSQRGPWYEYQRGTASYYSTGFWFRKTANGERFLPFCYTAAHKTLPFDTVVKVVNAENGRTVYVRINDRGPFVKKRIIDLSSAAAKKVGIYTRGTGRVILYTRKKIK